MTLRSDFAKQIGESGLPPFVDPSIADTWGVYEAQSGGDRVLSVLGFMFLVRQAGMKRKLSIKDDPKVLYSKFRAEEFDTEAALLARQLVRYHIFDALKVYKSKFTKVLPIRGTERTFRFDLCLEPRKKEHLDSALAKLSGLLYNGDVPKQLREVWRKLPLSSQAKPKSSLPKCNLLVSAESTLGFLALLAKSKSAIFARRAADDILVMRLVTTVDVQPVPWLTDRQHNELLKSLVSKAFSKLKG